MRRKLNQTRRTVPEARAVKRTLPQPWRGTAQGRRFSKFPPRSAQSVHAQGPRRESRLSIVRSEPDQLGRGYRHDGGTHPDGARATQPGHSDDSLRATHRGVQPVARYREGKTNSGSFRGQTCTNWRNPRSRFVVRFASRYDRETAGKQGKDYKGRAPETPLPAEPRRRGRSSRDVSGCAGRYPRMCERS